MPLRLVSQRLRLGRALHQGLGALRDRMVQLLGARLPQLRESGLAVRAYGPAGLGEIRPPLGI
eukprot:2719866-Lingulodinium_polyedra.AAC.1